MGDHHRHLWGEGLAYVPTYVGQLPQILSDEKRRVQGIHSVDPSNAVRQFRLTGTSPDTCNIEVLTNHEKRSSMTTTGCTVKLGPTLGELGACNTQQAAHNCRGAFLLNLKYGSQLGDSAVFSDVVVNIHKPCSNIVFMGTAVRHPAKPYGNRMDQFPAEIKSKRTDKITGKVTPGTSAFSNFRIKFMGALHADQIVNDNKTTVPYGVIPAVYTVGHRYCDSLTTLFAEFYLDRSKPSATLTHMLDEWARDPTLCRRQCQTLPAYVFGVIKSAVPRQISKELSSDHIAFITKRAIANVAAGVAAKTGLDEYILEIASLSMETKAHMWQIVSSANYDCSPLYLPVQSGLSRKSRPRHVAQRLISVEHAL